MLRVDIGRSVPRRAWRALCKSSRRVVGVQGEQGAVIHLRFDAYGFTAWGQGCSPECEYTAARAIVDAITDHVGQPPLAIYCEFRHVTVN